MVDNETLRDRLLTHTTNTFGKHPEELAAALDHKDGAESTYRRLGAAIIDGTKPPVEVEPRLHWIVIRQPSVSYDAQS